MMNSSNRVIVLFSGGLDSSVLLYWLRHTQHEPIPLIINYIGRPIAEQKAARKILECFKPVTSYEITLDFYADLEHLRESFPLPVSLKQAPNVFLPMKTLLFYAIAGYYAVIHQAPRIAGGHHRVDTTAFPDTHPEFFRSLENLLTWSQWDNYKIHLWLPFINWRKAEIVRLGMELDVPLDAIWSCYHDRETPCGTCGGCEAFQTAFSDARHLEVRWPDLPE